MIWMVAGGVQFYSGSNPFLNKKMQSSKTLISVSELETGAGSENASIGLSLSINAGPHLVDPPLTGDVYTNDKLIFSGEINSISWGDTIQVSLEA